MNRQPKLWIALATAAAALLIKAQPAPDTLEQGFRNPPDSAKPRTWWHWTGGNITKEGITKDLEWMKRVGIGGFQLADVASGSGQTVEHKIWYGSPEWYDAVKHAAAEADRLGLEMAIFSSPGWSETGGPWVKPEQAMKKLVWSETTVEGPRSFSGTLPHPPANNGPVRDSTAGARPGDPTFYADAAVLAYPTPTEEVPIAQAAPKITASSGAIDGSALIDDSLNTSATIPAPTDSSPAWLQFEFARPYRARAISIGGRGIPVGRVLASDDGATFRTLTVLPGPQGYHGALIRTFAFPETEARIFRVELDAAPLTPAAVIHGGPIVPARQFVLTEAKLYSGGRVHRFEDKTGSNSLMDEYESSPTPPVVGNAEIGRAGIVNLTSKLSSDGTLRWDVPGGRWTILRIGYSLTGMKNKPPVPSGSGFEADKLSRTHMQEYYHGYFDPLAQALGPLFGKSLRYVMMDSWEAGMENWTEDMPAEFRKRRGYDPTPYLPVLTGRIVESADVSDRFLWDFRRTIADLFAENHYGTMAEELRRHGVGIYAEASGVALEILEDSLLNKSKVEIPMAEFWVHALHPESMYYVDVRGAASAAHVYGKPIAAAESFTGGGYEAPFTLKRVADYWFAQGINRLVFHTSAHQPLDTKPGNTMVGTHINRNITWAEQAAPLMNYFSRTSYMLQQGRFVADLAYLLREGAPSTMPFWGAGLRPPLPDGYDYDFVNTDGLLNRMTAGENGAVTFPDGMSYRAIVLPPTDAMTLPVLRKIRDLVAAGATVVGPKPTHSPSLAGYPEGDSEIHTIAADLWGDADGITVLQHSYGKGHVYWNKPLDEVLTSLGAAKDFDYSSGVDAKLAWIHRATPNADIYFVANQADTPEHVEARFRVEGRQAELWHADTGGIEPVAYTIAGGCTTVPLNLADRESVFVVFRRNTATPSRRIPILTERTVGTAEGAWDVTFPPNLGAPEKVQFARLESWTANPDPGVKYFSGTATYRKVIQAPAATPGAKLLLDLGVVKDLAEITVNGKDLGVLWKPPYVVDATSALKTGVNQLEIRVTNEWTNRQIGYRVGPQDKRVFPAPPGAGAGRGGFAFGPQTPIESGLLGPVRIVESAPQTAPPPAVVAGIPVNYDEARVGTYTLPNPLKLENGKPVRDAKTWNEKRRPELIHLFEENEYGHAPARPAAMSFDVFDKGTPTFDGAAIRKQVTIYFTADKNGPKMDLLLYTPAKTDKPAPLLLQVGFSANSSSVDDPGVKQGTVWGRDKTRVPAPRGGFGLGHLNVKSIIEHGYGVATFYYGDVEPDFIGGEGLGIRAAYKDTWGAIAAWGWGLSRAMDYLETDKSVDAKRVAIYGVSRLGKTVMWAGAHDPRFAMVIASCSGEGGAALSRRDYGETIAHLTAPTRFPYQFAAKYADYAKHVDRLPVDAHELVALIAPRPVLLQTGSTDYWSDPKGEFLAAVAAAPVYRLLGKEPLGTDQWPPAGTPILHDIGYYMHEGGHGTLPGDWEIFYRFMDMHLK